MSNEDLLIVEDDPDLREVLDLALTAEGYRVATAANGAEALEALKRSTRKPRLILLDLMMPIMNGWEFRQKQVQDPDLVDIPVVIVSAVIDLPMRTTDLKANAYLRKPLQLGQLLETVQKYA